MTTFTLKKVFASSPATYRSRPTVLGGDPKGKNFLYTNGKCVFIRDIENPAICDVYEQHQRDATVAKYSPSGLYIASGDVSGKLRIWDTTNKEHLLKYEYQPLSGTIKDIAWSPDGETLVIVGEGRGEFAAAILLDSGSSVGDLRNSDKSVNTCDYKPTWPYRVVTGSDDYKVSFYEGPPFRFLSLPDVYEPHRNFVYSTRYSPSGEFFCAGDYSGTCAIYHGETGEFIGNLGRGAAHRGGILGTVWSMDGRQLLTVSDDKTAKIWDVETSQDVAEFVMGNQLEDQQVSCLWQNDYILTVSLSGDINYLDPKDTSKPYKVIKGHQQAIEDLTFSNDKSKIYSGSYDGDINCWDISDGHATGTLGRSAGIFSQMALRDGKISTIAPVQGLREIEAETMHYVGDGTTLDFQAAGVARGANNLVVVVGMEEFAGGKIALFRDGRMVSSLGVPFSCTAVDIHPNDSEIAVGDRAGVLHIYTISGDTIQEKQSVTCQGEVTRCRYSPSGEYLAATSSSKTIGLWEVNHRGDYQDVGYTQKHSAQVTDVAWSPDGQYYGSTCLDGSISIWKVSDPERDGHQRTALHPWAHGLGVSVKCLQWMGDHTIISGGADNSIRMFEVSLN